MRCGALIGAALLLASCSSATRSASPPPVSTTPASTTPAPTASTPAPSGAGGSGTACSLASAAEVSAAYGEQFDAGGGASPGGNSACTFQQSNGGVDTVGLVVATSQADVFYTGNRSVYPSVDLTGLGDKAFVSNDGGQIAIENGSTTISVHVIGFTSLPPAQLQAMQKAFGRLLVGRV
jgi:hypothetical protein